MIETLEAVVEQIHAGKTEAAQRALDGVKLTEDNRSEVHFLQAYLKELNLDRVNALDLYEKVLDEDPDHTEAAFRAALLADTFGDDDHAISLYDRCAAHPPVHINALMNLAMLLEERGDFFDAKMHLQSILGEQPNHVRAQQLLKSVESSLTMAYDEQSQRDRDRKDAILDVPITDFELSVRSRNCLKQMNIRTLGDLLRISELELLSYRNFGETSLNEIKNLLTNRGLRLGQALDPAPPSAPVPAAPAISSDAALNMRRPIAELELSVRSRKALQRLGVVTLGELTQRSEPELLSIKNFGQTSLTEIKQQLAANGLSLRNSP
ncbi:MAG: tetratricopeptide repeat protein [Planctomycetes bacterium]|nr:tetratricopeptide repeat protein [Planctomycetota bacterium]MBI3835866.1 tetratricopeptide repeat protein [Planctomycetota bacterium]